MLLEKAYPIDTFSLISESDTRLFYIPIVAQLKNTEIAVKVIDSLEDLDLKVAIATKVEETGTVSRVGYLIRTRERAINFGTGLLIVKNSWYSVSKLTKPFINEDIALRIKLDGLISYNVPNKLAIFSTPYLSTKLHEYLTMI
jgi:hypothetical protein